MFKIDVINGSKFLIVKPVALTRFRFYDKDRQKIALKFIKNYGRYIAAVDDVYIYRLPTCAAYHYQAYLLNNQSLRGVANISHDDLVDNMMEFIQKI